MTPEPSDNKTKIYDFTQVDLFRLFQINLHPILRLLLLTTFEYFSFEILSIPFRNFSILSEIYVTFSFFQSKIK